jgi:FkbM family methyltransferase
MIYNLLKKLRPVFFKYGFVVKKRMPWMENYKWLQNYKIESILDIGANIGQFALFASEIFPTAKIYSFEPIPSVFEELKKNSNGKNILPFNLALGESEGTLEITVNQASPSSSFLDLGEKHINNWGNAIPLKKESVKISTLDLFCSSQDLKFPLLVKLDVQGFEDKVINGGLSVLSKAEIVIIELSYDALYKNQPLFGDVYIMITNLGFIFKGFLGEQGYFHETGEPLYCDGVFIKRSA